MGEAEDFERRDTLNGVFGRRAATQDAVIAHEIGVRVGTQGRLQLAPEPARSRRRIADDRNRAPSSARHFGSAVASGSPITAQALAAG